MKKIQKIWGVFTTVLTVVVVILAVALVGIRLFGFQVFSVLSGSMEPEFPVGSLIYVKKTDPKELDAGDVITYMLSEDTVSTHRIVEILPDEDDPSVLRFVTKGDANEEVDGSTVHSRNVIGTPVFSLPLLGYLANFISEPPGTYVSVSVAAVILALAFLPDVFGESYKGMHERLPEHCESRRKKR